MVTKQRSNPSLDRHNWNKIFKGLVKMLQSQQSQLETLSGDKKLLEDHINAQHRRWLSEITLFEHQIALVKEDLRVQDMASSLEAAKSELVVGLKQREACLRELRLGNTESELEDFKAMLKLASNKSLDPPKGGRGRNANKSSSANKAEQRSEILELEVRRLKHEYDMLASEKNSEVSALLAEKNFVWNQYKILEKDCANKLKSKSLKVEQAEERIQALVASMEHLQSSNDRKDNNTVRLTDQLSKMKEESEKFKEEAKRLSKELDLLRKSRNSLVTPILNRCTSKTTRSSNLRGKQSEANNGKEPSSVRVAPKSLEDSRKVGKKSKRIVDGGASSSSSMLLDSPKLISSSFKVPKLKDSASIVRL